MPDPKQPGTVPTLPKGPVTKLIDGDRLAEVVRSLPARAQDLKRLELQITSNELATFRNFVELAKTRHGIEHRILQSKQFVQQIPRAIHEVMVRNPRAMNKVMMLQRIQLHMMREMMALGQMRLLAIKKHADAVNKNAAGTMIEESVDLSRFLKNAGAKNKN